MGREERSNLRGLTSGVPIIGGGTRTAQLPPEVRDQVGRVLVEGDGVILQTQSSPIFRVQSIKVVVEPGVPPGFMDITLVSQARFRAPRGVQNQEFLRVIESGEQKSESSAGERYEVPPEGDPT